MATKDEGAVTERKRMRGAGLALALAVASSVALPAARVAVAGHQCGSQVPAGTKCARSNVLVEHKRSRDRLVGDVNSHMRWCVRNRTVLFRKVRDGRDKTLARTRSGRRGWFAFELGDWHGRFYAAAQFKDRTYGIDGHDMCWRARSRKIRLG